MLEIIQFAQNHGLELSEVIPDGKIRRFKVAPDDHRKSGWVVCYQNHTLKSGEVFHVAVIGNYRTGETYTYQDEKIHLTREDRKNIKDQMAKAKARENEEREKHHREVALDVEIKINSLSTRGESEYLNGKQIQGREYGILFDEQNNIFVPVRDVDGKLWSIQKISESGEKRFYPGGRVQGCFHIIGSLGDTVYMCEGFATGASIHIATGDGVVVAFNSGNLPGVARILKERFPDKSFIIAGDDDRFKEKNAGREKAEEAATSSLGRAIYPTFANRDSKGTDFNDLHREEGIDAVKSQVASVQVPRLSLHALGFKEGEYFFTSSSNRQIVPISSFTEKDFLHLMPGSYWEAVFPGRTDNSRVDWFAARTALMEKCRERGLFNGFNVRGAGVWMDAGRIVVNMGDHLIVDGSRVGLGDIKSKYFYTLGMNLSDLNNNPLTTQECSPLVQVCDSFKWVKKDSGVLLAGALVLSRVCGALPVRPHLWLTGGAETGKTTILEKLIYRIVGNNALYVARGTTEAGVRQELKSNSVPVVFDEFETMNNRGDEIIESIIELCRSSWSDSSARIIKGGANGNATHYSARFSAIVSSIRTKLTNDADKGRFAVVELAPHGADPDHWKVIKEHLASIDEEFADRLFARTIRMLPTILSNQRVMQSVLSKRSGSRFGDQYGMILAGYASLIYDGVITPEEGEWLADQVNLDEEKEISKNADQEDAIKHLMTTKVSYECGNLKSESLLGDMIQTVIKNPSTAEFERKALSNLGIRVESEYVGIAASGHSEMQSKIWRNTKWSQNWGVTLKRLPGAEKKKIRIVAGKTDWAIIIHHSVFT